MLIQNVLIIQRLPRPVLALQQHRSTLQAFQAVPLPGRDIDERPAGDHVNGLGQLAILIIEVFLEMPANPGTAFFSTNEKDVCFQSLMTELIAVKKSFLPII